MLLHSSLADRRLTSDSARQGDKQTSLYDIYGLIYKSPTIIHCNRIWTCE